jgi:hypothetical protein
MDTNPSTLAFKSVSLSEESQRFIDRIIELIKKTPADAWEVPDESRRLATLDLTGSNGDTLAIFENGFGRWDELDESLGYTVICVGESAQAINDKLDAVIAFEVGAWLNATVEDWPVEEEGEAQP